MMPGAARQEDSKSYFRVGLSCLHDVLLDLDEELLHGKDVVRDVERANGDEERCVVKADEFPQHCPTQLGLRESE